MKWLHAMLASAALFATIADAAPELVAQQAPATAANGRENARIDITGQWVSIINEDWRWRMITPPKGDAASVPLNPAGRKVTDAWDLAKDRANGMLCKAFGPPALIRQPGRIRIDWDDDNTLRLEFDAGMQMRRFHFHQLAPAGPRSLQGFSAASWFRQPQDRGVFARTTPKNGGSLVVVTTNLRAGYLRSNGVPYSERTVVKEFFDTFTLPEDGAWLIVTTVVNDPQYLSDEFIISSQFKKEHDRSKWNPRPCDIPPPRVLAPARPESSLDRATVSRGEVR
jgi:hypothetical protein